MNNTEVKKALIETLEAYKNERQRLENLNTNNIIEMKTIFIHGLCNYWHYKYLPNFELIDSLQDLLEKYVRINFYLNYTPSQLYIDDKSILTGLDYRIEFLYKLIDNNFTDCRIDFLNK